MLKIISFRRMDCLFLAVSDLSLDTRSAPESENEENRRGAQGGLATTDTNPACAPTSRGIMLEMSEIDRFGAIGIDSDTFEKLKC